jgi:formate hydrogenlyase subunit 4
MRLSLLLGLLANLFAPWGVATTPSWAGLLIGAVALIVKLTLLGGVLAAGEVLLAKVRLFRVPELLAGSFVLALLAVTASYVLA